MMQHRHLLFIGNHQCFYIQKRLNLVQCENQSLCGSYNDNKYVAGQEN